MTWGAHLDAGALHLLIGSTGAGKTTFARRMLRDQSKVIFLSIDAWMAELFWPDAPDPPDIAWALERVRRVRCRMVATAVAAATAGLAVMIEAGWVDANARCGVLDAADLAGLPVIAHLFETDAETRWSRTQNRNSEGGELSFPIDRAMFDEVEAQFRAPAPDELSRHRSVHHYS